MPEQLELTAGMKFDTPELQHAAMMWCHGEWREGSYTYGEGGVEGRFNQSGRSSSLTKHVYTHPV